MTPSLTDRERLWAEIRAISTDPHAALPRLAPGQITAAGLALRIHPDPPDELARLPQADNALRLLHALVDAGLAERAERRRPSGSWYSDVVYVLTEAGRRAARPGAPAPAAVVAPRPDWQRQAWTACRIGRQVTAPDVARVVEGASYDQVYRYLLRLTKAGFLMRHGRRGTNGAAGSHAVYRVRVDPGPEPPLRYGPQAKTRRARHARP